MLVVGFDGEGVVGARGADRGGGLCLGVHRINGDHGPGHIDGFQQVPHGGDLVALGPHGDLPEGGGPAQGRDQMGCPTGAAAGPAQAFAVQGDDPQPLHQGQAGGGPHAQHPVEQVAVHTGEGAAEGRLVGCAPAHAQGGQGASGGLGGPLADRGEALGSGQDRADRDRDQRGQ